MSEGAAGRSRLSTEAEVRLAKRVRQGDREAFAKLVDAYMRPAFSIAYRILEDPADAEDLVQEAFVRALDRIETFEPGRPFGPWFYRILWNRGLNVREARSRRAAEPLPAEARSDADGPSAAAGRAELRRRVEQAMASLSERQRDVVRLAYLEGLSSSEIAEMMGIADGTVRWHLHEARGKLRDLLDEYEEDVT